MKFIALGLIGRYMRMELDMKDLLTNLSTSERELLMHAIQQELEKYKQTLLPEEWCSCAKATCNRNIKQWIRKERVRERERERESGKGKCRVLLPKARRG